MLAAGLAILLALGIVAGVLVSRGGSGSGAGAGGMTPSAHPDSRTRRPNIVLILTDDQRSDQLGNMPTVDRELVEKGVNFTNGFVVDPLCCPSRTTILTGRYSHSTDVYWNRPPNGGFATFRPEDHSTVATWLQAAHYRTALIGKYLNGYEPADASYVPPGWNVWDALALPGSGDGLGGYYDYVLSENGKQVRFGSDPSDYSTDVFSKMATSFITSTPASQPLFLYYAPRAPHVPSTPPQRYAHACPNVKPLRPPSYDQADVSDMPAYIRALPRMSPQLRAFDDHLHTLNCQSLLGVDDSVKAILGALQRTGRLSNTLIVFASDNGYQFGEHRVTGKKVPYEESIRVPIVVRYDPVTHLHARTDTHLVLNLDFAQTFAAVAGIRAPGAEGRSLLPLLENPSTPWRTHFLVEHWEPVHAPPFPERDRPPNPTIYVPPYCAVRTESDMYIKYSTGEQELYDVRTDPYELHNLAGDPADAALLARLHGQMVHLCSPPPPNFTP